MYALIWARAAVLRARSACPIILGSTSAANSAMITTTTIISISVTPACRRFVFFMASPPPALLHCNIVHADNRQHDTQDQNAHDQPHRQDDQRFKQRCKAPDGCARVRIVDI